MILLHRKVTLCLLILVFFVPEHAMASQREDAIKSGFIYNFARYSQGEWFDATQQSSYNLCSFDTQFVDVATHTLNNLNIENVPVVVHLLTSTTEKISDCNTLFISKNDIDKWMYLVTNKALSKLKLMLVGESDNFIASGGQINFFITGGKVRFEVDTVKLERAGIHMSSRVLRLGRTHKGSL